MKLKSKLTSMLLVVSTVLTSINLPLFTISVKAMTVSSTNNMVATDNGELEPVVVKGSPETSIAEAVQSKQILRISLIKTTEDDNNPMGGFPATNNEVPGLLENPISLCTTANQSWFDNNNVSTPANQDVARFDKGLSKQNSRREYLNENTSGTSTTDRTVLSYGGYWQRYSDDPKNPGYYQGQWTKSDDATFKTEAISVYPDECIPDLIPITGKTKATYHENPPAGASWTSSSEPAEYFDQVVRATWADDKYGQTDFKQVFIYRMLSKMMHKTSDPYCEEVEQIYQLVLDGKLKILVEPCLIFDVSKSRQPLKRCLVIIAIFMLQ